MARCVPFLVFFFFASFTFGNDEVRTAHESIRRLKKCMDIVDSPETRKACKGTEGIEKDECIEKFTQKMMPILNECIERSRRAITVQGRDEL